MRSQRTGPYSGLIETWKSMTPWAGFNSIGPLSYEFLLGIQVENPAQIKSHTSNGTQTKKTNVRAQIKGPYFKPKPKQKPESWAHTVNLFPFQDPWPCCGPCCCLSAASRCCGHCCSGLPVILASVALISLSELRGYLWGVVDKRVVGEPLMLDFLLAPYLLERDLNSGPLACLEGGRESELACPSRFPFKLLGGSVSLTKGALQGR